MPSAHGTQADSFVLPSVAVNVPLGQSRQTLTPGVDEYLPLAHGTQSVAASLPCVARYVPLAQLLQTGAPASEYEPAAQAMQVL